MSKKRSSKKSGPRLPEYYDSIDMMPVDAFRRILEKGDLSWMLVKRKKLSSAILPAMVKAWERVYDEYLAAFKELMDFTLDEKKLQIARMQMELVLTGERILETEIELAEDELADMESGGVKTTFMDTKIAIESRFKFQINLKETSVREFYSYIPYLKSAA